MLALDLFCGGGGVCIGMQWAGFEVVGVDIKPHPNYPSHFIQADVHNLPVDVMDFDFCWASPPCQLFSTARIRATAKRKAVNLIPITRKILKGHPYSVIENVPQSPLLVGLALNAPSVGLEWMTRKRIFELSFLVWQPVLRKPKAMSFIVRKSGGYFDQKEKERNEKYGLPVTVPMDVKKAFMGIPQDHKMNRDEVGEAVPPAYSEFIAREAMRQIQMDRS